MNKKIAKFKKADIVRVIEGVKDPDFQINIGGWSGKVEQANLVKNGAWMYTVVWDQATLLAAGDDYENRCETNNLDFERIDLEEQELELVANSTNVNTGSFVA